MPFFPISLAVKIKVIKASYKAHVTWPLTTALMPFPPRFSLVSTPTMPVSRIHRLARHVPAPGPLHQLFPLLGSLFPKIPLGLIYLLASEF